MLGAIDSLPSGPRLIDLEPNTLDDVLDDILRVGEALDVSVEAGQLERELRNRRDAVAAKTAAIAVTDRPRVAFENAIPRNGEG